MALIVNIHPISVQRKRLRIGVMRVYGKSLTHSEATFRGHLTPSLFWDQALESTMSIRPVKRLIQSKPTLEGAGVHLRRAFGFGNTSEFDPFLLLDDFRNDIPEDYLAGFPWHPHRGIE